MDDYYLFNFRELKTKAKGSRTCALYGATIGGPIGAAIGSALGAAVVTTYQELHKDKDKE